MTAVKVSDIFRLKPQEGFVGIEIEVEGSRLVNDNFGHWRVVPDGSLKSGVEYVLASPIPMEDVDSALNEVQAAFKANKTSVRDSVRAGVHIHFNAQQLTLVQLGNALTSYFIFEELLTRFCAPRRHGNLFALRLMDAFGLLHVMTEAFANRDFHLLGTDDIRYSALNLTALPKFGSLEFRALETGTFDPERIKLWIKLLHCIVAFGASNKFDNPRDILRSFSEDGEEAFAETVFGPDLAAKFITCYDDCRYKMMDGCRAIQDFVYTVDWSGLADAKPSAPKRKTGLMMDELRIRPMPAPRDMPAPPWDAGPQPVEENVRFDDDEEDEDN
jgi:hypothetical protein